MNSEIKAVACAVIRPRLFFVAPAVNISLRKFKLCGVWSNAPRLVALRLRVYADVFKLFQPVHSASRVFYVFSNKQIHKKTVRFYPAPFKQGGGVFDSFNLRYLVATETDIFNPFQTGDNVRYAPINKPRVHTLIEVDSVICPGKLRKLFYAVLTRQNVVVHKDELFCVRPYYVPPISIRPDIALFFRHNTPFTPIRTAPRYVADSIITFGIKGVVGEKAVNLRGKLRVQPVARASFDCVSGQVWIFRREVKNLA